MVTYQTKLAGILEVSGWSKDKLADLLNVSNASLSHWVNGKAEPDEENARKIDKLYERLTTKFEQHLEYTRREYIESAEKSFHRHEIYELDKNNHSTS